MHCSARALDFLQKRHSAGMCGLSRVQSSGAGARGGRSPSASEPPANVRSSGTQRSAISAAERASELAAAAQAQADALLASEDPGLGEAWAAAAEADRAVLSRLLATAPAGKSQKTYI